MEIEDDSLERTIERIVDRRVTERLAELRGTERQRSDPGESGGAFATARRRGVLKALGAGAIGFGAGVVPCVTGGEVQPTAAGVGDRSENSVTEDSSDRSDAATERTTVGRTLVARPGEIQGKIDKAAAGTGRGRIVLQPGIEYDPPREIHVKKNVDFDFNGGRIVQTGDHNTLFVGHGARIRNGIIDRSRIGKSATSTAVLLDAERAGDDYRNAAGDYTGVDVQCDVLGPEEANDVGLQLIGRELNGIDLGNRFDMQIRNCGKGLDVYTERYLNGPEFWLGLIGNGVNIDHRGTDMFDSTIYGWIQPESGSRVGIRNQTNNRSVTFIGEFWDPDTYERYSLEGPKITVLSTAATGVQFEGTTDRRNLTSVRSWFHEQESVYNAQSDTTFEARFDAGAMHYLVDGKRVMDIGKDYIDIYNTLRDRGN